MANLANFTWCMGYEWAKMCGSGPIDEKPNCPFLPLTYSNCQRDESKAKILSFFPSNLAISHEFFNFYIFQVVAPSLLRSFSPSLLHSFTPSLLHSFTPSLLHSFTPSLLRSFAPSLLRSFAPSLLRSFAPSLLRSFAPSLLRSFAPSLLRSFAPSLLRSFAPSLLHTFAPSRLRSFAPSLLRSFAPSLLRSFAPSLLHSRVGTRAGGGGSGWWTPIWEGQGCSLENFNLTPKGDYCGNYSGFIRP